MAVFLLILEWTLRALAGICMAVGWLLLTAHVGLGKAYAFYGVLISIFFLDSWRRNSRSKNRPSGP